MEIEFSFPEGIQRYRSVSSRHQLASMIKKQSSYKEEHTRYAILVIRNAYLYARCRLCKARLSYKYCNQEELYKLTRFENNHHHSLRGSYKKIALTKFIHDLPQNFTGQAAKLITMNSFPGLSQSQFYHAYRRIKNPSLNYRQLISKLDKQEYEMLSDPFDTNSNQLPELLIITNQLMKDRFRKYGSFVCFDTTYHLIKQRKDGKIYKVGLFCGLSLSRKIVPYCLVIVLDETKERYYEIFRSFTNLMGLSPKFIITDQSAAMIAAIKELKNDNQIDSDHIFDIFHMARNIRKRLVKKENLSYFMQILKAQTGKQFEASVQQAYDSLQVEEINILDKLINQKSQSCYAYVKPELIGFSCSNSINQKVHDLLKSRIIRQQPFTKAVIASLKLMDQLLSKSESWQIERIPIQRYHFRQIKQVRCSVDKRILQEFCNQLQKLIYIDTEQIGQSILHLYDRRLDWHLMVMIQEDDLKCQCRFTQKSGIPCAHLIRACLILKKRIIKTFNHRWLIQQENTKSAKRISTGKKTRRNRK